MSRTERLQALEYDAESSWAEASSSFTKRIPMLAGMIYDLVQEKVDAERTVQYLQEGTHDIRGTKSGEIGWDEHAVGHGTTTQDVTPTVADHETRLGYFIGNATAGGAATSATGGSATAPTTAAASGLTAGQIIFGGDAGDGRAEAQASVIDTHSGSTANLLVGLPSAMNSGDKIASAVMLYPQEATLSAPTSQRMRVLTARQSYACRGVYPASLALAGINPNEKPRWSFRTGVSDFDPVAPTFPSAVAVPTYAPAPCSGGSLFFAAKGTATRSGNTYRVRAFSFQLELGVAPDVGTEGVGAFQSMVSAIRGPARATATFIIDHEAATTTPVWHDRWDSDTANYHLLYTFSKAASGRRIALYGPNVRIIGRKPIQMGHNGVLREQITVRFDTDTAGATELTKSAFRFGYG